MTMIFLASFFFLSFAAGEAFAFRCGSDLVSEGDSKTQVTAACGHPTDKDKSCEDSQEYTTISKSGKTKHVKKCSRKLETWTYNCGENDFIYRLTFDDGKIINIKTGGRGKGRSDCLGK